MTDSICLISFSNNADHQNVIYSMFKSLHKKVKVYTIGVIKPKAYNATYTENNFYFNCPLRPGITKDTFKISNLLKIAKLIKDKNIKYLYFESQHIWNVFLMLLCPYCVNIVAVHDVIPHSDSKGMGLCNYISCKIADHVILRNNMHKELFFKKYNVSEEKVTCFELWREFDAKTPIVYSKRFLCFGRIRKYKGMDSLEKIIQRTPHINYDIVGSPDKESIPIVEKLKSYSNVTICDSEISDEEMKAYFSNTDWVILPYSSATQSGVIVDAYKFSRPVIAFDVGAISEQIINGKTGFLIENNDIENFINIINKVNCFTQKELEAYSINAYEYGYSKYAAEAVADKFVKIINSCDK